MTKLLFPLKGHRNVFVFVFRLPWRRTGGHSVVMVRNCKCDFNESFNSNLMNMNKVSLNVFESRTVSQESPSSLIVAVFAHVGGPHRGRVVIPDERQHYYQRLHWSHTQGLERRDRRMYPHPLWAYLNSALHAPTWEKVWGELTSEPFCPLLCETRAFGED